MSSEETASFPQVGEEAGFSSVATESFLDLLTKLGISIMATAYRSGKLIVIRAKNGALNTHFESMARPMGLALRRGELAIGVHHEIVFYQNHPDAASLVKPPEPHTAFYIPRRKHSTGDIAIHEIGWIGDELWAVNTRFSCLCTFDDRYSFVPRWRPPFVSAYAAEDRCHLNGMAVGNGRVEYVTCLGKSDTARGWHPNKKTGGILYSVPDEAIIVEGLCMPHSPRLFGDQLWVLESGRGRVLLVDRASGKLTEIARLPGFARGIDIYGNLVFVGLSGVRDPMTSASESAEPWHCGIWVLDLHTAKTVAFLRFEGGGINEIFDLRVLPNVPFPGLCSEDPEILANSFILPDPVLAELAISSNTISS